MTDKSFGDHMNRNVVKNPLLSTAVTGLSIEDLTHNAVLLPVSLSQEAITRPDQQIGSQVRNLKQSEHSILNYPSGDANTTPYPINLPPQTTTNLTTTQKPNHPDTGIEKPSSTLLKASVKSDDDFDVNEYFARLQGTRYVSAPLSSIVNDTNANIGAEDLEEINLNEPDKADKAEVQQSITADIAQNFSQLPAVLPQMASAVFSSFSNMLQPKKSREPTPDLKVGGYQEVQFEKPAHSDVGREVAPPPRELMMPPTVGTGNYRLPTKKKYAQIPGLTSSEHAQMPYQPNQALPPQNVPQYFIPTTENQNQIQQTQTLQTSAPIQNPSPLIQNIQTAPQNLPPPIQNLQTPQKIQTPTQNLPQPGTHVTKTMDKSNENSNKTYFVPNFESNEPKKELDKTVQAQNIPVVRNVNVGHSEINMFAKAIDDNSENLQTAVLPPPPMFSNTPRRDSQSNTAKSLLPPSVARRISANQPCLKTPQAAFTTSDNIFIPQLDSTEGSQESIPSSAFAQFNPQMASMPPASFAGINPLLPSAPVGPPGVTGPKSDVIPPPSIFNPLSVPETKPLQSYAPPAGFAPPILSSSLQSSPPNNPPFEITAPPLKLPPTAAQSLTQPSMFAANVPNTQPAPPFYPPSSSISAPPLFNPSAIAKAETKEFPPIPNQSLASDLVNPELIMPEPPKASGIISYRMNKKRPQYYSGPIEGIGAISNNVKPVIAPVASNQFQGALFTPFAPQESSGLAPNVEQVPFDISRPAEVPFDISRPVEVAAPLQMPDYNTAFDMSRPTSEVYNEPKQETGGFGILGSLKSKLTSLDINKLQSSVTTFFDPAYNTAKKDEAINAPYNTAPASYEQQSNFEVFVPNFEVNQSPYSNQYYEQQQYYQNLDAYSYQTQAQNTTNYFANIPSYQEAAVPTYPINSEYTQENIQTPVTNTTQGAQATERIANVNIQHSYSAIPTYQPEKAIPGSQTANIQEEYKVQDTYAPPMLSQGIEEIKMHDQFSAPAPPMITTSNVEVKLHNEAQNVAQLEVDSRKPFEETHTSVSESLHIDTIVQSKVREVTYPAPQDFSQNGSDLLMKMLNPQTNLSTQTNTNLSMNVGANIAQTGSDMSTNFFDNPQLNMTQNFRPNESKSQNVVTDQQKQEDLNLSEAATFFDNAQKQPKNQGIDNLQTKEDHIYINPESKENDTPNMMYQLKSNPADFFATFSQGDTTPESFFSKYTFDSKSKTTTDALHEQTKNIERNKEKSVTEAPDMSSAPLLGLSTMLADKTREMTYLENEMTHMTMHEPTKETMQKNTNITFFENTVNTELMLSKDEKDLNICETCREVKKPEDRDKDDDLTQQLIENITSPIQLSNPVEVPLTESNTIDVNVDTDKPDFGFSQCAEIFHITEETIETIQVQSAAELLDDEDEIALEANVRNYGWSTDDSPLPTKGLENKDYPLSALQCKSLEPGYTLPVDPNAIGFYGNNALFKIMAGNVADEIKSDVEADPDAPVILPRQMSLPTAPPEEEDTKSEGIDVHSIELDAKKDFPIFEEFVIEPSENDDDDVIERVRSSENVQDSFTSRVDKYQNKDDSETYDYSPIFGLTTSPSVPMASYFDTGNYAVETHYRNSLTSPTLAFGSPNQISVPPGFEEEFNRRLGSNSKENIDITYIPETSTQTKPIYSPTYTSAQNTLGVTTTVATTKMTGSIAEVTSKVERLPDFNSVFAKNPVDFEAADTMPSHLAIGSIATQNKITESVAADYLAAVNITGSIESDDIATCNIPAGNIPTGKISTGNLATGNTATGNTATSNTAAGNIHTGNITSGNAATGNIASGNIAFSNIDAGNIASGNTATGNLATGNIPTGNISTPLTATGNTATSNTAAGNIPTGNIASGNIPTGNTATDNILTGNIYTGNVATGNIATGNIASSNIDACNIASGNIATSNLATGNIATVKTATGATAFESIAAERKGSAEDNKPTELAGMFAVKEEDKFGLTLTETPKTIPIQPQTIPLQDPINFFGSSSDTCPNSDPNDSGFNRLASYFSSPPKTDNSKSFFELSQGQNHYRQDTNVKKDTVNPMKSENYFETTQNIPDTQYLANLKLMKDLTSIQNAEFKSEQVVRTVNYFTIEYDNEKLVHAFKTELNKGEPDLRIGKDAPNVDAIEIVDDKTVLNYVRKCKLCCDHTIGFTKRFDNINHEVLTIFKVKKCMDNNSGTEKNKSMEVPSDDIQRRSISVNFDGSEVPESNAEVDIITENRTSVEYTPVKHHWFYRVDVEDKSTWRGFSVIDSKALEKAFNSPDLNDQTLVPTDGGRYDVNINGRLRFAVYWADKPSNVRRCSWFYKGATDARYVPYTEVVAEKLEEEYRHGITTGEWHRRLVLPNNEMVVMHGPAVMVHFLQAASDAFSSPAIFSTAFGKRVYRNPPKIRVSRDQPPRIDHLIMMVHGAGEYRHQKEKIQSTMRPRVVRRGYDESEIEEMEPTSIDHLLLLCHGVGSACDMRFRNVEEVVDDFRATSLQLIQSHYKNSFESGDVGRVEVLPISWHATLHSGETGVDRRLARITLDSIPRLRNFTNDTVLDVLFYTSPVFCQTIINTVCDELNRIYKLFKQRNPTFSGGVSLGGHSLGSVILYDLLSHQAPALHKSQSSSPVHAHPDKRFVSSNEGCGQPSVKYPRLDFSPVALYALGSPIAIFECIRGVDSLGKDFSLPTCKNFFNIFHPYDPIAYRIEPLINPDLQDVKPYLIPHHKGRKRMHLELKDTMARVGADIKAKLIESIKSTWSSMWKSQPPTDTQLEKRLQVVEEEMEKENLTADTDEVQVPVEPQVTPEMLGLLNAGRRIDYVLQEAPFEMINEYLFAMSSHVCYWESEDTMLLMLREIYDALGVQPDSTVPQQSLTVHRTRPAKPEETAATATNIDHPSTSRGGS